MQYVRKQNPSGRYDLYLDLGEIKLPNAENIEDWKVFPIKTYTKVSNNNHDHLWNINFQVVNDFFEHIDDSDAADIAMLLITMNYEIAEFMRDEELDKLTELLNKLAFLLHDLDSHIHLYKKIVDYCRDHVPMSDLSNAGKRAQDTEELTFYEDDVLRLLGVVVLSKLMAPIFGTLMTYLVDKQVESKLKEPHCVSIMRKLFDRCCPDLIRKLQFYIRHGIKNEFDEDMTAIHHGLTSNSLQNQIFSTLLTRNFVNVDLFRKNGKLMVFVNVSIKKTISTQKHNMNNNRVMVRCDMSSAGDEENRRSHLEIDSVTSSKTADVALIISNGLDRSIFSFLAEYDIEIDEYERCLRWYQKHPVYVNEMNKFVLQSFIGPYIGGAKSLLMLGASDIAKISTILQMMCVSLGYRELGHMITCHVGDTIKTEATKNDQLMRINYKNSKHYRNFRAKLEYNIIPKQATKHFDNVMSEIIEAATTQVYIYNTAPYIWDLIEESSEHNGRRIDFTPNLIPAICDVIMTTSQIK